jgi:sugar O-acyltransferase (sialic acid O-acetyltransferase NeuD family)
MEATNNIKKLIIIGGVGKGEQVLDCIIDNRINFNDNEYEVAGFLNDFVEGFICDYPVLGTLNDISTYIENGYYFSFAIHPIGKNQVLKSILERLNIPENQLATIISKRAFVSITSIIEPGVIILAFAYVSMHVHIGSCSMIMARTSVGHNTVIGKCCFVGTGSTLSSYVEMGNYVSTAIGSTVLEYCKLGDCSVLGAGGLLLKELPENCIYVGNPAKYLKNTTSY